ncbi:MAG: SPOR domain-containing protein [Bacteroidetes bacterium]|nr:SPOR domain-containing protein [Bacteroidota bacterium]
MILLKTALFFTLILFHFNIYSQDNSASDSLNTVSNVSVIKDTRINEILNTYKSSYSLSGYRIQIFSDNKKQPARDEKAKFLNLYSSVKAHEVYQQPFFKIRVGDFRTKLEAYKFQKEIQLQFPNCFIVKDEIEVEQLLNNE